MSVVLYQLITAQGLTEEEIEEAVRIAQPKLDQVSRSQAAAKSTSNTQQVNIKTSQSQPNMLSSASPSRGSQGKHIVEFRTLLTPCTGNELQSSSSTQSSWYLYVLAWPPPVLNEFAIRGKILLASMAVVGLGSGLGVLAKKYTKEHLADLWGTTDNGRSVRERKNVEHDERLREISSSIHKLHEAVDRNIKEVSDMNRRLIALESAPSLDHVKTEILNTTQNMITSNSLSELQQEVKSLRTLMLNIATQNGGNGPEDKKSEAAAPPIAKVIEQVEMKPSSSAGGASVPQGLPNARIFRNLANAGKVGQAASGAGSASGSSKGKGETSRSVLSTHGKLQCLQMMNKFRVLTRKRSKMIPQPWKMKFLFHTHRTSKKSLTSFRCIVFHSTCRTESSSKEGFLAMFAKLMILLWATLSQRPLQ